MPCHSGLREPRNAPAELRFSTGTSRLSGYSLGPTTPKGSYRADQGAVMGHDKNDELREEHNEQDEQRQERRDGEFFEGTDGADLGSQDDRREEGDEKKHH